MKKTILYSLFFFNLISYAQTHSNWTFDVNYFKGNIALHNDDILHLIKGHPEGILLSWNKTTFGDNDWEQRYNYPDYGVSFSYQDLKNDVLGNNYALYAHYNFYFLNRHLMFRVGQGLGYTTNPYDRENNHKNNAFGSRLMSSTMLMINYKHELLVKQLGIQAGLAMIHYSNANVKAPNTSVNTVTFNVGVNYKFDAEKREYIYNLSGEKFKQPIKYNFVFRSGINESDVIGSGQFPFYIISAYADKRLNHKSAIQFGTDVFFSNFLKELIKYRSISFPNDNVDPDTDYKRVGVFVGHELFVNRMSFITQLGFYVYYPYDFEGRIYQRLGFKYYFNDTWFAAATLKSHAARAEAIEFGIGVRL